MVLIQNYFLSAPYGRNWLYLWSSQAVPAWQIVILIIVFFVGIWIALLWIFSYMSKSHSWVLPLFAMGLGAPRWAQILWSTSGMGHYLPWTAGPIASGLAARALWLWLGVLDALQGVGKSSPCLCITATFPYTSPSHPFRLANTTSHLPRFRNDTPSNPDPLPRSLHANRGPNARLAGNHSGASLCSR